VDNKIVGLDLENLKSSDLYRELVAYSKQGNGSSTEKQEPPPILFFCDKRLPNSIINPITKTAVMAGFPNFQFAVLRK